MKIKDFIAMSVVSCALVSAASAQVSRSLDQNKELHTQAQLKQLTREAHAPEQYQVLAAYYADQQKYFLQQAADEKTEWELRGQNVVGVLAKYPRPVDSAKYLYQSFVEKANEAGLRSAKYSQEGNATLTTAVQGHM
jgi:hypothetical protein